MAMFACSRIKARISLFVFGSIPPVSTRSNVLPAHSQGAYSLSLVTPGVSSTMERRWPASLLNSSDLPTFGLPTMATNGLFIC